MKTLKQRVYAYRFLDDFILIYPLYAVMFSDRGLNAAQIASLFVVWSTIAILFEIPTGILGDKLSRRKLLAFSQIIQAIGYALWLLVPNYWGFVAGFIFWGLKSALSSGTYEALLFDEMKAKDADKDYVRVMGAAETFSLIGILTATGIASAAIKFGYNFVLSISILVPLITAVVAWNLPEATKQESLSQEEAKHLHTIAKGIKQALSDPTMLRIIAFLAFVAITYGALEEYFPLFAANIQLPKFAVPLVVLGTGITSAIASYLAHWFQKTGRIFIIVFLALAGVCLVIAASLSGVLAAVMLAVFVLFIRLLEIVFQGRLQHAIGSEARATITSVSSFVTEIGCVIFYIGYGFLATRNSNLGAFKVIGEIVVAAAVLGMFIGPRLLLKRKAA